MPKGKGTYGSQVGRPPEDGSKRSKKTYAGGGLTGYNVPQPQGTEWGQMRDDVGIMEYEEGGRPRKRRGNKKYAEGENPEVDKVRNEMIKLEKDISSGSIDKTVYKTKKKIMRNKLKRLTSK